MNDNGVNDCLETKLTNGELDLTSDKDKYYFNTPGTITATVYDNKGRVARFDSTSQVDISISKIVDQVSGETVYDVSDSDLSDTSVIPNYIASTDTTVPLNL